MKRIGKRMLALLLSVMTLFGSSIPALAMDFQEGVTCSSRIGRKIVGSDGKYFTSPEGGYPILVYDAEGNASFKWHEKGGIDHGHMYLYTEYNVDETWAYCVEGGIDFTASNNGYASQSGSNSLYFQNLPAAARKGIALVTLYGYQPGKGLPIEGINYDDFFMASQILIWEYQQGLRTSPTDLHDSGPIPWDLYYNQLAGRPAETVYNWILEQMARHSVVPSFASDDIFEAPTYTMKYQPDSGVYSVTLTDENNLDIDYQELSNTGISVSRNGNQYTFSTPSIINNPITLTYRKSIPVFGEPLLIWGRPGYQTMCTGADDPVQFYLRLETESVGTLKIVKTAEDEGISLEGWQFRVEGNGLNTTVTTGPGGVISIPDLIAGRYTISEINVPDYYYQPESQTVDVLPGQTTEVQFYNRYKTGGMTLEKSSELDKMTAGVQFRITGVCDNGKTYDQIHTTDETGRISIEWLYPGSYTIAEVGVGDIGIPDWIVAPTTQTVRVNADEITNVSFHNALKRGDLEIQKQSEDGQFVEGIGFRIYGTADCGEKYDETFYTDASGRITVEDMLAGTYFVQEIAETVNSNYYVAATQIVVIKQDETTTTQSYNKLKRVPLKIIKDSYNHKNLAGIQFKVYGTTAAGSYWEHTYTTNDAGIVDVAERDADAPPCGTYTITELRSSVNIGYILPTDKQETFTYGDKIELYFYNAPEMGTLRVLKTDDLDNHFVAGVEFQLKGTSLTGDEINLTAVTDSGGVAEFPEVPVGKYLLYEDNVPFHFVKPDPEEVTVVYARTEEEAVENKAKRTDLHIIKTSTDMQAIEGVPFRVVGIPLAGIEFAYDETFYTDSAGEIYVPNLLMGNYSIIELDSDVTIGYIKPDSQNVTLEYGRPETVEFFNKLIVNDIRVVKYDGFDNQPIEGVLFGLFDADGNEYARGRTGVSGELIFEDVPYGSYTLRELEGKTGYKVLESSIPVEVETDGITQEIPVPNERIPCELQIYKTDGTSKEPLAGAVFGLYDPDGNLVEQAVSSTDGYAHFSPQVWGQAFVIKEISAPEGYLPMEQEIPVDIEPGDTELVYEAVNEREPCVIGIWKTDGFNNEPLEGVLFGLFAADTDEMLQSGRTDAEGLLYFDPIPWGMAVEIRELEPLTGYYPFETSEIFINRGDTLIELEAVNDRRPVDIEIEKVDGETGQPIPGVTFGLYDESGNLLQTCVSNDTGRVRFEGIPWGQKVYVQEIEAVEGYVRNQDRIEFEPKPDDECLYRTIENRPIRGHIRIIKQDGDTGDRLAGVLFGLFDSNGNEVARGTTDESGELAFDVRYGNYILRELEGLPGYQALQQPIEVSVETDGQEIVLNLPNHKLPVSPQTGERPNWGGYTLLFGSMGAMALCGYMKKRKRG